MERYVNLFLVQIQEPAGSSTTTRAFVLLAKFITTKKLKQKVDDNLSVCMPEHSPHALSITGDIKINQCHVIRR